MNGGSLLQDILAGVAERGRSLLGPGPGAKASVASILDECETLLTGHGEASGVALARRLVGQLDALTGGERLEFFRALAERYSPDPETVRAAAVAYAEVPDAEHLQALLVASEPPRQELFRRLNLAPGATHSLVDLRRELLGHLRNEPDLGVVDADLTRLFLSWFNRGFLVMRRINWQTPAHILEKLIEYEAVHEIHGWDELRRRLAPADRRCFAFFHPALPDDPLIFVEVALTDSIPDTIAAVLSDEREVVTGTRRTVAVFYSISNCQAGLKGISFGNFLIKQVVEDLRQGLPSLKTFVTLSPVPGLRRWLDRCAQKEAPCRAVIDLLQGPDWHTDEALADDLKKRLLPLVARYFLVEKRSDQTPPDPVARFHLGNGASLHRLNWLGDPSSKGMLESAGLMVNYLYDPAAIEANHEAYADRRKVIASRAVRGLLPAQRSRKGRASTDG
jgi:malonyl-CoA decarboxylase